MTDFYQDDYATRLRALEVARERIEAQRESPDTELLVVDVASGLNSVYDLLEAMCRHLKIGKMPAQDVYLRANGGEVVGALAFARGARTHKLIQLQGSAGYDDLPYGEGPYGGGPIWTEYASDDPNFADRAAWYDSHVKWSALWAPFDDALIWFRSQTSVIPTREV